MRKCKIKIQYIFNTKNDSWDDKYLKAKANSDNDLPLTKII